MELSMFCESSCTISDVHYYNGRARGYVVCIRKQLRLDIHGCVYCA